MFNLKFFQKVKSYAKELSWPSANESFKDTTFVVISTAILSIAILLWTGCIENIVDWVLSFT